jgi:glutamate racemase
MIGVFDSGVGGLGVFSGIRRLLPKADLVYLADQAAAPYGDRSLDEVRQHAEDITAHLITSGATEVVVACNTASAAALDHLRQRHPETPIVGMEPAVKPAASTTSSGVVGVLATPATFQGTVFDSLVDRFATSITVIPRPCPGLAQLIENGDIETARRQAASHIGALVAAGADTVVLGCTHYAFLATAIGADFPDLTIIDPAPAVARQAARVSSEPGGSATSTYLATGDPQHFADKASRLLGFPVRAEGVQLTDSTPS